MTNSVTCEKKNGVSDVIKLIVSPPEENNTSSKELCFSECLTVLCGLGDNYVFRTNCKESHEKISTMYDIWKHYKCEQRIVCYINIPKTTRHDKLYNIFRYGNQTINRTKYRYLVNFVWKQLLIKMMDYILIYHQNKNKILTDMNMDTSKNTMVQFIKRCINNYIVYDKPRYKFEKLNNRKTLCSVTYLDDLSGDETEPSTPITPEDLALDTE